MFAGIAKANAQTTGGTTTAAQKKTQINKQEKKRIQRGTGQYYGSKDTTPGSPMGTGGAGGDNMSGSPAASANETHEDAQLNKDTSDSVGDTTNMNGRTQKKSMIKKTTRSVNHKSRSY